MNLINQRYFSLLITLLTCLLALLSSLALDYDFLFRFVDEGGFIETLTLAFYLIAALFVLCYPRTTIKLTSRIAIAILMLAMLAREADLHKVFGMSMLKIKFWLTAESTISDKFCAALILIFLIFSLYTLIRHSTKNYLIDLKHGQYYAVTILIFFIVLIVSKIIDRSVNMIYEMTSWLAPTWVIALQLPQEEYLECLLPLLIIIAIMQYDHSKKISNH
ncbi:hypothetical protein RHO14_12710 [Orbus wheelerorum]|uniref:hypothetical protein n=1 Tax=Orbus wheelerorum TaxID=3074111 RepID=UPI00370D4BDB